MVQVISIDVDSTACITVEQLQAADNKETRNLSIVVQMKFHPDMLCVFDKNTVCILTVPYGTNLYDFKLSTLLVVDDVNEGILIAWAMSN